MPPPENPKGGDKRGSTGGGSRDRSRDQPRSKDGPSSRDRSAPPNGAPPNGQSRRGPPDSGQGSRQPSPREDSQRRSQSQGTGSQGARRSLVPDPNKGRPPEQNPRNQAPPGANPDSRQRSSVSGSQPSSRQQRPSSVSPQAVPAERSRSPQGRQPSPRNPPAQQDQQQPKQQRPDQRQKSREESSGKEGRKIRKSVSTVQQIEDKEQTWKQEQQFQQQQWARQQQQIKDNRDRRDQSRAAMASEGPPQVDEQPQNQRQLRQPQPPRQRSRPQKEEENVMNEEESPQSQQLSRFNQRSATGNFDQPAPDDKRNQQLAQLQSLQMNFEQQRNRDFDVQKIQEQQQVQQQAQAQYQKRHQQLAHLQNLQRQLRAQQQDQLQVDQQRKDNSAGGATWEAQRDLNLGQNPEEPVFSFDVVLERVADLKLGLEYRISKTQTPNRMYVVSIKDEGLAQLWNSRQEKDDHQFKAGDMILRVNNETNPHTMVDKLKNAPVLVMTVQRSTPQQLTQHGESYVPNQMRVTPQMPPQIPNNRTPEQIQAPSGGARPAGAMPVPGGPYSGPSGPFTAGSMARPKASPDLSRSAFQQQPSELPPDDNDLEIPRVGPKPAAQDNVEYGGLHSGWKNWESGKIPQSQLSPNGASNTQPPMPYGQPNGATYGQSAVPYGQPNGVANTQPSYGQPNGASAYGPYGAQLPPQNQYGQPNGSPYNKPEEVVTFPQPVKGNQAMSTVKMTINNVDYHRLDERTKSELKSGIAKALATGACVPEASVQVALTAGSIKVTAQFVIPSGAISRRSIETTVSSDAMRQKILQTAQSIQGMQWAAYGEMSVTKPEVRVQENAQNADFFPVDSGVGMGLGSMSHSAKPKASIDFEDVALQMSDEDYSEEEIISREQEYAQGYPQALESPREDMAVSVIARYPPWLVCQCPQGTYYSNEQTGESTWQAPPDLHAAMWEDNPQMTGSAPDGYYETPQEMPQATPPFQEEEEEDLLGIGVDREADEEEVAAASMIQQRFRQKQIAAGFMGAMGSEKKLTAVRQMTAPLEGGSAVQSRWNKALLHAAEVADEKVMERRKSVLDGAITAVQAPSEERDGTLSLWDYMNMFSRNLLLTAAVPIFAIMLSGAGKGAMIYVALQKRNGYRLPLAFLAFMGFFGLYLCDFFAPPDGAPKMKSPFGRLVFLGAFVCGGFSVLVSVDRYPGAPLICALIFAPAVLIGCNFLAAKATQLKADDGSDMDQVSLKLSRNKHEILDLFQSSMAMSLLFNGTWVLFLWLFWVYDASFEGHNKWGDEYVAEQEAKGITEERFNKSQRSVSVILWCAPAVASSVCFVLSALMWFSLMLHRKLHPGKQAGDKVDDSEKIRMLTKICKSVILVFFSVGCSLWVGASVAGSELKVASTVSSFLVLGGSLMCLYVYYTLQGEDQAMLKKVAASHPIIRNVRDFAYKSPWSKAMAVGMAVFTIWPYIMLSFLNQRVRRCRGQTSGGIFTARLHAQIAAVKQWPWTIVLVNLHWVCVWYVILEAVAGVGTNILLAWIGSVLQSASFMTLCIAFLCIGIGMFLIPVIPGIPVYLFGGILIPKVNAPVTTDADGNMSINEYDFWFGFVVAVCLNFFLKMSAITLQQKGIGEPLSHNRWVLQNTQVHTPTMKAVEMILKQPGMTLQKVTILCGGPDWPTSVLTGILRLSLLQMLFGSQPVMINVLLVTSAGAFKIRKEMSNQWEAMASVALSLGVFWNLMLMVLATYYIQDTWEKHYHHLNIRRPEHLELDWLDYVSAKKNEAVASMTEWDKLTSCTRYQLGASALALVFATYLMTQAQEMCWEPFEVTDDIAMLNEDFLHAPGAFAIFLFIVGCISLKVYFVWETSMTKAEVTQIENDLQKEKDSVLKEWAKEALDPSKAQAAHMSGTALRCAVDSVEGEVKLLVKQSEKGSVEERKFYTDFHTDLDDFGRRLAALEAKSK